MACRLGISFAYDIDTRSEGEEVVREQSLIVLRILLQILITSMNLLKRLQKEIRKDILRLSICFVFQSLSQDCP